MELSFDSIQDLLGDELTLVQRGILITIMLLREEDKKLTLAKFKSKTKINKIREDLISLHEEGYIIWSEYKAAVRYLKNKTINPEIIELIKYINTLLRTSYKAKDKTIISMLKARLQDYSIKDIKAVFANRYSVWKDDTMMSQYLTPFTILRPSKFSKYLEEVRMTKEGLFYVNVKEINLKKGDIITYKLSQQLINDDVYELRIYTIFQGQRKGNGLLTKRLGKDIKKILLGMVQSSKRGRMPDTEITYSGN